MVGPVSRRDARWTEPGPPSATRSRYYITQGNCKFILGMNGEPSTILQVESRTGQLDPQPTAGHQIAMHSESNKKIGTISSGN